MGALPPPGTAVTFGAPSASGGRVGGVGRSAGGAASTKISEAQNRCRMGPSVEMTVDPSRGLPRSSYRGLVEAHVAVRFRVRGMTCPARAFVTIQQRDGLAA